MKAVVYEEYGFADVLHLAEVDEPAPNEDEVLVRVHAASINSADWDMLRGRFPRSGLRRPKTRILGADIAGRVEGVGSEVRRFRPGDEVFGDISEDGLGGFAEFVSVPAASLAPKSRTMTFEQAAAVPQAAGLALQALRKGQMRSGHRVLLNGAGGGVGTFAIQLGKSLGAEVTGVDHTSKLDAMRSLGADRVIDYTKEDFTRDGHGYDLIVDVMASRPASAYRKVLRRGGSCVIVGGSLPRIVGLLSLGNVRMTGGRRISLLLYRPKTEDLEHMNELFESGAVAPVVDSQYPLAEVPEAMRRFGEGQVIGKLVITIDGRSIPKQA
jgi:NADPH:quinone reductase-like Zn-dependent oxidoreductase